MAHAKKKACAHQTVLLDASEYGRKTAGFERVRIDKRIAATTRSGRVPDGGTSSLGPAAPDASTFPGPLVLPDDELALHPRYPSQSLRSWINGGYRNPITPDRKTLYVADVPRIEDSAAFMRDWAEPDVEDIIDPEEFPRLEHPGTGDLVEYLTAFYHPLEVKLLPVPMRFVRWEGAREGKVAGRPGMVGLATGETTIVGVRARPSKDEIARMQLNLNDLLDALMGVLPGDAYASVMVAAQDLYEDEEDDFCCGRAFGGSRISVVSSFRYRPVLDLAFGVEVGHMWPLAHCGRFVEGFCEEFERENGEEGGRKRKRGGRKAESDGEVVLDLKKRTGTALGAAINAAKKVVVPKTKEDQRGLWFSRVARTAAHELGHCFGMDHCVYYACVMQGTAGLGEDARQPPYLCPGCEARVVYGLGEMGVVEGGNGGRWAEGRKMEVERERMEAMRAFCEGWKGVGMFAGYWGWLEERLKQFATDDKKF
ncbi:Archaemetzincin-2 [Colletotrichum kahawae]|uniref:Archaemetzincin-2 n=1 Tax=Colletotrichum kahawae TaxID=34407 RepID=A0AAD9YB83_COLKA|nr:Archaemetzincin-2 [Colletotrichum kahawae]